MMSKAFVRVSFAGILLVTLATLPASAQPPYIPAGDDYWVTPANGFTFFEFPEGEVESLCGAAPSSAWNHRVALRGIPAPGSDYDTVVTRLDKAAFDPSGLAITRIQVKHLAFTSMGQQNTPCGPLTWNVRLFGPQPITTMRVQRLTQLGGVFAADISVRVELQATDANGNYVGSLFYTRELPDPANGTPWSFGKDGQFRAGMTESNNCIDVLRAKLAATDPESDHYYRISNMIAQGQCTDRATN